MGATSKTLTVVLAALTAVLWLLAVAVEYGWLSVAELDNTSAQAFAVFGVITLIVTIAFYKLDL